MQRIDRVAGLALAFFGIAVFWSARHFPAVPGQKVGAGFLPMIVAGGLALCGAALAWRSTRNARYAGEVRSGPRAESFGSAFVMMGIVAFYVLAADRLGFLIVVPLGLLAGFRVFRIGWTPALLCAVFGTLVIHVAFYKLLRVPLPWGVLRPLY